MAKKPASNGPTEADAPRCPWCSSALPQTGLATCPTCGASLTEPEAADVPGLTKIDPEAILRSRSPSQKSRGLMGWLSGEYRDRPAEAEPKVTFEPPDDEVRREMARSRAAMHAALGSAPRAVSYPFGAASEREMSIASGEGYDGGFGLAGRWNGDAMAVTRLPVYPWSLPMPGVGILAGAERAGALGANRCSVGTSLWTRYRERRSVAPAPAAEALAGD